MNVSGMGGAALPPITPASSPQSIVGTSSGTSSEAVTSDGAPAGSIRPPGQQRSLHNESTTKPHKEVQKPAPLPPLRGLTIAEIRAMLGVAPLPGQTEATLMAASNGIETSIISAALDRYA
jgi:hypothetical protein